jgi:lipopolysaccharide export system protein LptA
MSRLKEDRRTVSMAWGLSFLVCSLLAFGCLTPVPAQARRTRAAAPRRQAQNQWTFGDVTLTNYTSLSGIFTKYVVAEGPNTTVDALDPKQKGTSRLQASKITVYFIEKTSNQVDRIEAVGNVRFSGKRPSAGGGDQTVRGTGSKALYYRQEGRVVLQGPVTFYAEQPTADGKGKQWVQGTAKEAEYDNEKETLSLTGGVNATVAAEGLEKPAKVTDAESIRLELAEHPYKFNIKGGNVNFQPKEPEKKP